MTSEEFAKAYEDKLARRLSATLWHVCDRAVASDEELLSAYVDAVRDEYQDPDSAGYDESIATMAAAAGLLLRATILARMGRA